MFISRSCCGSVAIAVLVVSLGWLPAHAASTVSYTLQLGGDNHVAQWKSALDPAFTPGSASDGSSYLQGSVVTWDTVAAVSGLHFQPGHPSDGYAAQGLANTPVTLELRAGNAAGPLVAADVFFSSINDGNGGDPVERAAFANSFDVEGNGPGRLIDTASGGGPFLSVFNYPAAAPGQLLGMGAGYAAWDRSGGAGTTTRGVGIGFFPNAPGLGAVPGMEGQINTALLDPGTYTLVLVPELGTNVLRGDVDLVSDSPAAFAVAANQANGDTITFTVVPEPATMSLLALGGLAALIRRKTGKNGGQKRGTVTYFTSHK